MPREHARAATAAVPSMGDGTGILNEVAAGGPVPDKGYALFMQLAEQKRVVTATGAAALVFMAFALAACGTDGPSDPEVARYVRQLSEMNAEARVDAARRLGRLGDAEAVPALRRATEDARPDVRTEAARALGRLGHPDAIDSLAALLDGREWQQRRAAAEAIGRIGDARGVRPLIEALGDSSPSVALVAASALVKIGEPSIGPLIELLDEQELDEDKLRHATYALGELGDDRAVEALLEQLAGRESRRIKAAIAEALGRIGSADVVQSLVALLEAMSERDIEEVDGEDRDRNEPVRIAARRALARTGPPAAESLAEAFAGEGSEQFRLEVLEALSGIDHPARTEAFIKALVDSERDVRRAAEQLLDDDTDRRRAILEPARLAVLLESERDDVQREAARRLEAVADESVVDDLIAALDAAGDEVRTSLAHALARIDTDAATEALADLLDDAAETVQFAAARALARRGDDRAVGMLKDMARLAHPDRVDDLDSDERDRVREAIAALGRLGDEDAVSVLEPVLEVNHRGLRTSAIDALKQIEAESALDAIATLLEDAPEEVRLRAAHALADRGDRRATPVMVDLVKKAHPDPDNDDDSIPGSVRDTAREGIDALVKLGDPDGFDAIVPLLKRYSWGDQGLRTAAIRALVDIDPDRAVEPIYEELKLTEWQAEGSLEAMCRVAGRLKDPKIADALIDWLQDPPPYEDIPRASDIRRAAAASLVDMGEIAVDSLIERMTDPRVREGTVGLVLAEIGEPALDPLLEALGDVDAERRRHAAWALGHMGNEQAVEPLLELLKDDSDSAVQGAAAWALGRLRDPRALEPLLAMVEADSDRLRGEVVGAIGRLRKPEALDPLVAALDDSAPQVRLAAARGLGVLGDRRAIEALRSAKEDDDHRVAAAARSSLSALGAR